MSTPTSDIKDEDKIEIKNKIEYYLGDEHLKQDVPLYQKISSTPDGYIELDTFLQFKDIKEKGWTKDNLKKGIELSQLVELDSTGNKIRRKNNLKLPEIKLLSHKRKEEEIKDDSDKDKENEENSNIIILKITTKKETTVPLKNILEEFKRLHPDLDVQYEQFKETQGYFGILLKKFQYIENIKLFTRFKIEDTEFHLEKLDGHELSEFWKTHKTEYDNYIKEKEKNGLNGPKKRKEIILGGKKYCNIGLVKMEVNSILSKTQPDEKLQGHAKRFVLDLCSYHKNFHEKNWRTGLCRCVYKRKK